MTTTFTCWRDASHKVGHHPLWGWPQCAECKAGPQYHERRATVGLLLEIVVPVTGHPAMTGIEPPSGIVGYPRGDRTLVSYEGFIYGGKDGLTPLETFRLGLLHAADRMVTDYPTIAQRFVPQGAVRCIGYYDPNALHEDPKRDPIEITDQAGLDAWLAI